jgi:hypothetical protein
MTGILIVASLHLQALENENPYDKPFVEHCSYDEKIPTPSAFLGYPFASRAATYAETRFYFQMLAGQKENIELYIYGETHEKRNLILLAISSPENMARLDEIKANIQKLTDPRKLRDNAEAEERIKTTPAIAWMAYSIHGDELSSTDAAIWLAYQLAAGQDETTQKILRETVVLIDPLQNPDGRERFLAQMRMFNGKVVNPDVQSAQHSGMWPWGRGNHYFYDLNRDFFILSQPETRARIQSFLEWRLQLFVDSHEMGPLDTYLFSPPREPINHNLTPMHHKWQTLFAEDQAKAFDTHGWSYYTREWLDMWYPGYTEWIAYSGALQILYEQAGVHGSAVRRADGATMTYRESVHHHFTSSLANLTTLAEHRGEFLQDYYQERQKTVQPPQKNEIHAYLIEPGANTGREKKLIDNLLWQGFEIYGADQSFRVSGLVNSFGESLPEKELPAGTYILPTDQPQKHIINAVFEFDPRLKDEFLAEERYYLEKRNESRMYDQSTWSMPIAYGVRCYQATFPIAIAKTRISAVKQQENPFPPERPKYGYILPGNDDASTFAICKLLEKGYAIHVAERDFRSGENKFVKGSFLLRNVENPHRFDEDFQQIIADTGARISKADTALDLQGVDLGGQYFSLLQTPRIGIFMGRTVSATSYGATWDLLDCKYRTRISSLDFDRISSLDLRKYNVLIIPSAWMGGAQGGLEPLKLWVENGGTLIAIGSAVSLLTHPNANMSAVRERADILDQLDVYMEEIEREENALHATASQADVWDYSPAKIEKATDAVERKSEDKDKLKRADAWERRFSPQGAFLRGVKDPDHWLAFGVNDPLAVMVNESRSYFAKSPVQTPVRFTDELSIRVSGLLWPEARKRYAKAAYVTREGKGKGQIILFPYQPNERGYYDETTRLLWNAVFLGPGLGAQAPIPW